MTEKTTPSAEAALGRLVSEIESAWPGDGLTYSSTVEALQRDGKPLLAEAYALAWHQLVGRQYAHDR